MGSAMTYEERQRSMFLLGPWLIGSFIEIFLQGALCSQFIRYFSWYSNDRAGTRLAVAGLALFTTLKAIHSFTTLWITFVVNFTDLEGAIHLSSATWWGAGNTLMVASIGIYVQIFYCHRLWVISKKNSYLLIIGTVLLFGYISICVATYDILHGTGHIQMWFAAHLSAVFAGDLLITLTTAFYLLKSRKAAVLPRTASIFTALVRLTFQTAAPAALCAMFNLIFSQIYVGEDKLISAAFNQALPTLYAFSMMWTLNARRSIRENRESHISIDLAPESGDSPLHQREGAVELAVHNQRIQVRTQTEVTQHHDIDSINETKGSDELKWKG